MNLLKICNKIIEYSFYGLFLLVPLVFTSATSELFELNKMWLTWGLTIIIATAWFTKMVLQRRIFIQRTPLDIPIGLFLLSQTISTIFSLDVHVSLWGYYSRFNGGLLSIISYIFLYYAFLSNLPEENMKAGGERGGPRRAPAMNEVNEDVGRGRSETGPAIKMVKRLLSLSLISGLIVALWGLPSHFGYDPTCFIFRGTLDVSCWTDQFQPKIRIFSTLGQPDWLAAYLAILLPISIIMFISFIKNLPLSIFYFLLSALFYIDLLFTRARSGVLGVWLSLIFFVAAFFWVNGKPKLSFPFEKIKSPLSILFLGFLILTFVIGTPINQLYGFTLEGITSHFQKIQTPKTPNKPSKTPTPTPTPVQSFESGGTESGNIRLLVWEGAINAWKANPIFGTGVETFAFAYYKYKPAEQNLTSEFNYLYNKAHNEYLNYLATTGLFGLGSYLLMIGWLVVKTINDLRHEKNSLILNHSSLIIALVAGYISILITNFFGFSVVIVNIYLFLIPAFVFVLADMIDYKKGESKIASYNMSIWQYTPIFFISFIGLFMLWTLFRFWQADIAYALGYNLDRAGDYQEGYKNLHTAVQLRGDEPVFKDELSINDAIVATALITQKNQTNQQQTVSVASTLAQEAINTNNEVISQYTNNVVFWKTRVRLFYTLSQVDSRYLPRALDGIQKASLLGPNDANIWYNLGVIYGQNNNIPKGIEALEKTIKLKPDYRDAHYALGLYYHQNNENEKAIAQMQYILDHIAPQNASALESIKNWK